MVRFEQSLRFQNALSAVDAANAEDPATEIVDGHATPRALLYAQRMTDTLRDYAPLASEAVCLAVRCQHYRRWTVPRETHPLGRVGYHRWRTELAGLQAGWAGATLREVGYPEDVVRRIESLLRKERLGDDPDTQLVEDTACLVFLRHYLEDFAQRHPHPKVVGVLRKTWCKMSSRGQIAAGRLELSPENGELIAAALSETVEKDPRPPMTREARRATA